MGKKKLICNNGTVIHKKPVMFSGGKLWRGRRCDISGTRLESKDLRHRSLVQKQKKKKKTLNVSHMTNSFVENEAATSLESRVRRFCTIISSLFRFFFHFTTRPLLLSVNFEFYSNY